MKRAGFGTVALAVVLVLATPVGAGTPVKKVFKAGKLSYTVVTTTDGPGAVGVTAPCPVGTRLTGGGGAIFGGAPGELDTSSMYPIDIGDQDDDADDAYRFEGHTHAVATAVKAQSVAICLKKGKLALSYRQDDSTGPNGALTLANNYPCQTGQQVTGAGLKLGGSAGDNGVESLGPYYDAATDVLTKSHSAWDAHKSVSETIPIESHTICFLPVAEKLRYRVKEFPVGEGQTRTVKVNCPGKTRVVGGGFGRYPENALMSLPFDDNDKGKAPDDGWKVRVHNDIGGEDYATAVCMT